MKFNKCGSVSDLNIPATSCNLQEIISLHGSSSNKRILSYRCWVT